MNVNEGNAKRLYHRLLRRYPILGAWRPSRLLFGNERPMRMNLRFRRFWRRCQAAYAGPRPAARSPLVRAAVEALRRNGYYIFPPAQDLSLVRGLAEQVNAWVVAGYTSVTPGLEEWMIEITICMTRAPEMVRLLRPEVVQTLEAYFSSYFKIYCAEIYRLVPTNDPPQASGLWHTDNYPPGLLKAMIYLTDTTDANGALRVHPRPATRWLLRHGFFDRFHADPFREPLNTRYVSLEAPAGSIVLWDSNLVHKGTPPTSGQRDAVAFKFLPSLEPWDRHLARIGEGINYERRKAQVPYDPTQIPADPAAVEV